MDRLVEPVVSETRESRRDLLAREVTEVFVDLSGIAAAEITVDAPFLSIGFDSLFLTQVASALKRHFNVPISFRQLLELTPTVASLADYLDQELDETLFRPADQIQASNFAEDLSGQDAKAGLPLIAEQQPAHLFNGMGSPNADMAELIRQQIDLLTRQLASLGAVIAPRSNAQESANTVDKPKSGNTGKANPVSHSGKIGPWKPIAKELYETDSEQSRLAVVALVEAYNRKTPLSKSFARKHRSHFADPRSSFSFSRQWKEAVYPIVSERSEGSRMWDIDGNEYLDIQSGFGSVLFGHNDAVVREAIVQQLDNGMQIGPQSALAGQVVDEICQLVNMDRATFCNTGSEAVLAAMRIARTATGKDMIVMFSGDYHGIFDEVVARRAGDMMALKSMPVAPGIPFEAVQNIVVLEFGDPASLDVLESISGEVAAVLIEPVQSRRPDHQPVEFLKKMRQWCTDNDVVYIFDEVITGFRVHPKGAQGLYGIQADLCAYGKIIGGGMPLGMLAGRRDLMDTLDGGIWDYGDDSVPEVGITYFAGTFVRHPLTVAAASATLQRITTDGDQLYAALHEMSDKFVSEMNVRLQVLGSPVHIQHCRSMMCVEFRVDSVFNPLFFINLRLNGVYMLESGTFFMTLAHNESDIQQLMRTFEQSASWMLEQGFHPSMHRQLETLSVAQQEIWLASQLSKEANLAYNTSMTLELRGEVDIENLKHAMIAVVNLHDSLRLSLSDSGQPSIGAPVLDLPVSEHDFRQLDFNEQSAALQAEADRDMRTPFDLGQAPLIRFSLFRLGESHCKLFITLHHLAGDGWSFGIIARHLGMLYEGIAIDDDSILQMPEYVTWLAEDDQQERIRTDVAFWTGVHKRTLPPLDLPLDGMRTAERTFVANSASVDAPAGLVQRIEQASRSAGVTSYHFLLGACQLLVKRLSGESQFNIAIPIAGQQHAERPNLVCHCVSLSCLRCDVPATDTVESLLQKTRSLVLDAFDHSFCNVTEIVDALALPRDTSRNPLFSVIFNVDMVDDGIRFGDLDVEIGKNSSQFEFSEFFLDIAVDGERMQLNCAFNSDLYSRESVDQWLHLFLLQAESMLSDFQAPVSALSVLSAADKSTIAGTNNTQTTYARTNTMVSLFAGQAVSGPERLALESSDGQMYDYATLDALSNQLARYLVESEAVGASTRVGVYLERDVSMVVALLAVMKSGAAYVPLDPLFPAKRLSLMVEDSQLSLVITQQQLLTGVPGSSVKPIVMDAEDALWRQCGEEPVCHAQASKTAYVVYTSGSMGRPKGVSVSHHSLMNLLCSMQQLPGLMPEDRLLAVTTLSFDMAALELYLPLITGARVVLASREESIDPMLLAERLNASAVTVMQATPATWQMLVDNGWAGQPDLKMLCGGEALGRDLADALLDRSDQLWNLYGSAETTIWATVARVERGAGLVGVGQPIANTQAYVLDEQMKVQPVGVSGELYIGGDCVAEGYVGLAKLTAAAFLQDTFVDEAGAMLYRTGERARWLRDGTLEMVGRLDEGEQIGYWRTQLAGAPGLLELPTDYARTVIQSFSGASETFELSASLTRRLKALSVQCDSTLFMGLLAAFSALLGRYSGDEDILVGSPIDNRVREELEPRIGFFVNSLVLRTDLSGDVNFVDLLSRVRETTLAAYEHQNVPFEKLVETLQPEQSQSYSPLFQVMFILQHSVESKLSLPSLDATTAQSRELTAKFDLTLECHEYDEQVFGTFNYSTALFKAQTIRRMMQHFLALLECLVDEPEQSVMRQPMLSEAESQQVLQDWNGSVAAYPIEQRLDQLFDAQVLRSPDGQALRVGQRSISYKEIDSQANRLAHSLIARGVSVGDRVGLCLERSEELVVGILAALKAGAAYVPLDPAYPKERIDYMLKNAEPSVVLTITGLVESLPQNYSAIVNLDERGKWMEYPDTQPEQRTSSNTTDSDRLAYIIYTSGSTGVPKGVEGTHRGTLNRCHWMWESYPFTADEVTCLKTATGFVDSVWELFGPLLSGVPIVILSDEQVKNPRQFLNVLNTERVSRLVVVPSLLNVLLEHLELAGETMPWLKHCTTSGETLSIELARRCLKTLPDVQLLNLYGSSEVSADVLWHEVSAWELSTDAARTKIPIGRPMTNTQVYVLDSHRLPVPEGVTGELWVGGQNLAGGYFRQEALTRERFIDLSINGAPVKRLFRTGDLGRWNGDGEIEYLGRNDSQVKLRGFRIELGEIESALLAHERVKEAVASLQGVDEHQQLMVHYTVEDGGADMLSHDMLKSWIAAKTPNYMVPDAFKLLDALPLTPNGKVDRMKLKEFVASTQSDRFVAPRTSEEIRIARVWSSVLKREQVSVEAGFFQMGGHSLLAARLVASLNKELGLQVPFLDVFQGCTVAEMAARSTASTGKASNDELTPIAASLAPIELVDRSEKLLPSLTHERFLFLAQMYPQGVAYNIPTLLALNGALDTEAFAQAVRCIVERHEALRTTFSIGDDGIYQTIHAETEHEHALIDVSDHADPSVEAQRLARVAANTAFDLSTGPVLRSLLIRYAPEQYLYCLVVHHIATDGWSATIFLRELKALYRQFSTGESAALSKPTLQYADYGQWERNQLASGAFDEQLQYWKERFEQAPEPLALPTDYNRPPTIAYRGAVVDFALPDVLFEKIRVYGQGLGVSLFSVLLGAYKVLLFKYTNQSDICVGSPIARRTRAELENLYGCLISSVAIRSDASGDPEVARFIEQVGSLTVEAFAHQDVPFDYVVEAVDPPRDTSYTPLFQTMFVYHTRHELGDERLGDVDVEVLPLAGDGAKYDLTLEVSEADGFAVANIEYSTDLFERKTIDRMVEHWQRVLEQMVSNPQLRLSDVSLLGDAEREQLMQEVNATQSEYPQQSTMVDLFMEQVLRDGDAVALEDIDGKQHSYAQLDKESTALANFLRAESVGRGDRVGVYLERGAPMLRALLAVMKSGASYVPLDPMFPDDRLAFMVEDAALKVVITQTALQDTVPGEGVRRIVLEDIEAESLSAESPETTRQNAQPEDAAYVIYTSGSTGQPKGVQVSHRSLLNFLCSMQQRPGLNATDRLLAVTTLSFDIAALELYLPLISGAQIVLASREESMDPVRLADRLGSSAATAMQATPATWRMLIESGWAGNPGLKMLCGGEALARDLAEALLDRSDQLWNLYGPTETTIWSTLARVERGEGLVGVGLPIANTQVYVLDEQRRLQPLGVSGELYIGGHGVAEGYVNRAELTASSFVPDPFSVELGARLYRTGDRARWRRDGTLEVLGRLDEQVKLRGYRIEPGEIRARLVEDKRLGDAVVVVREDELGDARLVGYLVAATGTEEDKRPSISELRKRLEETLPGYMVPGNWCWLESLPLTPNGKVDRKALPMPESAEMIATEDYQAPQSENEKVLASIWSEVLGLERVGRSDSFFALGGHSLKAVQVVSRVRDELALELPLRIIFESPGLVEMCAAIDSLQSKSPENVLKDLDDGEVEFTF